MPAWRSTRTIKCPLRVGESTGAADGLPIRIGSRDRQWTENTQHIWLLGSAGARSRIPESRAREPGQRAGPESRAKGRCTVALFAFARDLRATTKEPAH